ncbi:MAG: acyl-CoA dehydrogenase family protein [Pseudomonadota bacterium]|nr:acyl-CoA dehydrogenase family protein [Pseudomonadota bacterium]
MDLNYSSEQQNFRNEVQRFLAESLPQDIRQRVRDGDQGRFKEDVQSWQSILHQHGWAAPAWPVEYGGTGWSKVQQYIFETECALADAPPQLAFGIKMIGPVLIRYGTPAQQQKFLPGVLSGTDWWCQGYSEPGSGSDLASLRMQAAREDDHYVLNGQKIWNTLGQFADWIFCLVRTDSSGKPQRGISFVLVDMKSPGIAVRPTRLLDGTYEVNEIWFDNVRVPVANRIGEENEGWTCAKFLLGHERTNIAGIGPSKRALLQLKQNAAGVIQDGTSLLEDALFSTKVAQVEIDLMALEITNLRVIVADAEKRAPGPEASILKIRGTEIAQRISELQLEVFGATALSFESESRIAGIEGAVSEARPPSNASADYLNLRKLSIFGGSNEIQRNIIAQMILGL